MLISYKNIIVRTSYFYMFFLYIYASKIRQFYLGKKQDDIQVKSKHRVGWFLSAGIDFRPFCRKIEDQEFNKYPI